MQEEVSQAKRTRKNVTIDSSVFASLFLTITSLRF